MAAPVDNRPLKTKADFNARIIRSRQALAGWRHELWLRIADRPMVLTLLQAERDVLYCLCDEAPESMRAKINVLIDRYEHTMAGLLN